MSPASSVLLARRYQLDGRIAAGGFGEVWRGTDVVLGRPVAVKLLHPGYTQHPETLARFRAEARHAGALAHEGIARVYDYGEPDLPYPPFLVMELVDGPSLAEVLAEGAMDPVRTMDIVAQAAAGLQAAHRAGLVHRDIKPGNLMLSRDGLVKITDFGIAHAAGSAPLTSTGMLIGTPGYLAPERTGGERATPACDLYSLGMVAYECLAGGAPCTGIPREVALAHRDRPMPPLPATVPAAVAALITDLTAKDPAARPDSAGEVARRAGQLRDRMTSGTSDSPADSSATADKRPPLSRPSAPRQRPRSGRPGRLAALCAALAMAALTGLLLTGVIGPVAPHRPVARPARTPGPGLSSVQMIQVNGSSLIGQPVTTVVRQLHQLGLVVRVVWRPSGQQPPGMVLSVRPLGQVTVGSLVEVTGALKPPTSRDSNPGIGDANAKAHDPGSTNAHGKGHDKGKGKDKEKSNGKK